MKIDNLEILNGLIAGAEGGTVEFKETTGQLERGMETLCAFLNGTGGTVLFGVTDKVTVPPVPMKAQKFQFPRPNLPRVVFF